MTADTKHTGNIYFCNERHGVFPNMEPEYREVILFWCDLIDILYQRWKKFRKDKNYKAADKVREWAKQCGVTFQNRNDDGYWWVSDQGFCGAYSYTHWYNNTATTC